MNTRAALWQFVIKKYLRKTYLLIHNELSEVLRFIFICLKFVLPIHSLLLDLVLTITRSSCRGRKRLNFLELIVVCFSPVYDHFPKNRGIPVINLRAIFYRTLDKVSDFLFIYP